MIRQTIGGAEFRGPVVEAAEPLPVLGSRPRMVPAGLFLQDRSDLGTPGFQTWLRGHGIAGSLGFDIPNPGSQDSLCDPAEGFYDFLVALHLVNVNACSSHRCYGARPKR